MPPDAPIDSRICLAAPAGMDLERLAPQLEEILSGFQIACLRFGPSRDSEAQTERAAGVLLDACAKNGLPLIIDDRADLVGPLRLHGVHLTDGSRGVAKARDLLGKRPIVGGACGISRHAGMTAGESGADYVSFGPLETAPGGGLDPAQRDLFMWWSELMEIPSMAHGNLTEDLVGELRDAADFFEFGDEIWSAQSPALELERLAAPLAKP